MQPVLLIYGYSTSGKTELGKALVSNGHYHIAVELDHIAKWLGKADHLPDKTPEFGPMFKSPDIEKGVIGAHLVNTVLTESDCIITGIWPKEDAHFLAVNKRPIEILVISPPISISTVKERWVRRSGFDKWKAHAEQFTQQHLETITARLMQVYNAAITNHTYISNDHVAFKYEWKQSPIIRSQY